MSKFEVMFPQHIMSVLTDACETRIVSARDLSSRNHPILPHHKVATAGELASAVMGCLHSMRDEDKINLIESLRATISLTETR